MASPKHEEFEVSGYVVKSYLDGFKVVRHVPYSILAKHGIGALDKSGEYVYDPTRFFTLDKLLAAVRELAAAVGPRKMFELGLEVPKNAILPPGATDIKSGMTVFDAGYHLNHRRNGVVMFDPLKRTMLEGIGHYRCASVADKRIVMEVDAPYPCDFDRGIMLAWAKRFEPTAAMTHLDPATCREKGAPRCRYELTWK